METPADAIGVSVLIGKPAAIEAGVKNRDELDIVIVGLK
jgi:hypothetical protein